jgi:hypothetical protein
VIRLLPEKLSNLIGTWKPTPIGTRVGVDVAVDPRLIRVQLDACIGKPNRPSSRRAKQRRATDAGATSG